jgi:hypothetical protein
MNLTGLIKLANFSASLVGYPGRDPLGKCVQPFRCQVDLAPGMLGQQRMWLLVGPADRQDQVLVCLRLDPHGARAVGPPNRDFLTEPWVNRERDPRTGP